MPPARPLPGDVTIRELAVGDAPQIRSFRCTNPGEPWTVAAELAVRLQAISAASSPDGFVLVAERGRMVVGIIVVTVDPVDPQLATSQVLAVTPEHRRQYIGYNLKLEALRRCARAGVATVASEVDVRNVAMRRCNQCFGATTMPEATDPDPLLSIVRPTT